MRDEVPLWAPVEAASHLGAAMRQHVLLPTMGFSQFRLENPPSAGGGRARPWVARRTGGAAARPSLGDAGPFCRVPPLLRSRRRAAAPLVSRQSRGSGSRRSRRSTPSPPTR
ncbi:MAG: hypothetical protein SGPRY_006248 [Prymnesium sp.]